MKYKIAPRAMAIFSIVILLGGTTSSAFNFTTTISEQPNEIIQEAYAIKAKGKYLTETNSNKVCGDRLCSETDGGRDAFEATMESYVELETLDDTVPVRGWLGDAVATITNSVDSVSRDVQDTYESASAAVSNAAKEVRNAAEQTANEVGQFTTSTWQQTVSTVERELAAADRTLSDANQVLNDAIAEVDRLRAEFDKLGTAVICADYAAQQCAGN